MKYIKNFAVFILLAFLMMGCYLEYQNDLGGKWVMFGDDGYREEVVFDKKSRQFTWAQFSGDASCTLKTGEYRTEMPVYNGKTTPVVKLSFNKDDKTEEYADAATVYYKLNYSEDGRSLELITNKSTLYYLVVEKEETPEEGSETPADNAEKAEEQ